VPSSRTVNGKALSSNVTLTTSDVGAEPAFAAGTTAQYRRGDKTWQTLDKTAVGLSNVNNTSDADKPVSTAQAAALATKADSSAGTYTPTLTNVTNTGSSSAFLCQWMRVGNTVTVSGRLQTTATAGGTASQLDVSLPVASNFTDGGGLGGAGTSFSGTGNVPVVIFTETANDRARFLFTPVSGSPQAIGFVFTYLVQ
jgi:hypothetical protein